MFPLDPLPPEVRSSVGDGSAKAELARRRNNATARRQAKSRRIDKDFEVKRLEADIPPPYALAGPVTSLSAPRLAAGQRFVEIVGPSPGERSDHARGRAGPRSRLDQVAQR